jgi:hypothetical protein
MRKILKQIVVLLILMTVSCKQKDDFTKFGLDCDLLKNGIINLDNSILRTEIAKLTLDLTPKPVPNDDLGHVVNFDSLISRINSCSKIHADIFCYGCIKTLPRQSEILIKTDSSGILVQRIIDITTSEKLNLEFAGSHRNE